MVRSHCRPSTERKSNNYNAPESSGFNYSGHFRFFVCLFIWLFLIPLSSAQTQAPTCQFSIYPSFPNPREHVLTAPSNLFLLQELALILWEASDHPAGVSSLLALSIGGPSPPGSATYALGHCALKRTTGAWHREVPGAQSCVNTDLAPEWSPGVWGKQRGSCESEIFSREGGGLCESLFSSPALAFCLAQVQRQLSVQKGRF